MALLQQGVTGDQGRPRVTTGLSACRAQGQLPHYPLSTGPLHLLHCFASLQGAPAPCSRVQAQGDASVAPEPLGKAAWEGPDPREKRQTQSPGMRRPGHVSRQVRAELAAWGPQGAPYTFPITSRSGVLGMCKPVGPDLRWGRQPRRGAPPPHCFPLILGPTPSHPPWPSPSGPRGCYPPRWPEDTLWSLPTHSPLVRAAGLRYTAQGRCLLLGPWGLPLLLDPSWSRPDLLALHRSLPTPGLSFPQGVSECLFCLCPARYPAGPSSSSPHRAEGRPRHQAFGLEPGGEGDSPLLGQATSWRSPRTAGPKSPAAGCAHSTPCALCWGPHRGRLCAWTPRAWRGNSCSPSLV